jgi:hypothetical protein
LFFSVVFLRSTFQWKKKNKIEDRIQKSHPNEKRKLQNREGNIDGIRDIYKVKEEIQIEERRTPK